MGSRTRGHHIVPDFILRSFARDGQIWTFDIQRETEFRTNTKNVMKRRDHNTVSLKNNIIADFEDTFERFETAAAPIIEKICASGSTRDLTLEEHYTLSAFVILQRARSQPSRDAAAKIHQHVKNLIPELPKEKVNPLHEYMDDDEFERFSYLNATLEHLENLVEHVTRLHIFCMVKNTALPLYISDNPVALHNYNDYGPYGNIGYAVPGIEIYMPISPEHVLAFMCPSILKKNADQIEKAKIDLEAAKTKLFKYGLAMHTKRPEIKEIEDKIRRAELNFSLMTEKKSLPISQENMLFLNSLQIQYGERHLCCQKKSFEFARKALREHPSWRTPPTITID